VNDPDSKDSCDEIPGERRIADLHAEYATQLNRLAWAILRDWDLAADAVQETFALLSQKIASVEECHLRGWLVKTVQFKALNLRRSQQRAINLVQRIREQPAGYAADCRLDDKTAAERLHQVEELQAAIRTLPEEQKQIVFMRLVLEKGFAEIASELQLPLGTVLSRMRLAVEKLRKRLTE
jgi:RNA polymerase sigma-70 factor, ECF subfamily